MAYLGNRPADSYLSLEKQTFTTSATASYALTNAVSNANEIALFLNNVRQEPTEAYSVSGTALTLSTAITSGDTMYCIYLGKSIGTINPTDGSVGLSQLSATGTKDATTFLRGDNTFAEAGGGKVLQVVNATDSTKRTTTSSSFVTASNTLSIDITPSATSSKILILVSSTTQATNDTGFATIYKDSTNLGNANGLVGTQADKGENPTAMIYLDSPNTTSATTYQVYIRSTGTGVGTISLNGTFSPASTGSIIAMEIGA